MKPLDLLRAPFSVPRLTLRALDDLNALAERARGEPDVVEQVQLRVDLLLAEVASVIVLAGEIISGGNDLNATGERLERRAAEIIDGGADLVEVGASLDEKLEVFRRALPQIMGAIDTMEELGERAETVADTMEPLQGAAEKVGRITRRLTRGNTDEDNDDSKQ